ncbi:hypothetical protein HYV83_05055 [Candidatus Woesearchaeota archaeon]|nr:hypothetical protein [Candidatus Woesearchaeota archaeon]
MVTNRLRKGMVETSALVGLVSVVFVGVILFIFLKNSALVNNDVTAKDACKRSVQQYAKLKVPGIDLTHTDTIRCPMRSITVDSGKDETANRGIAKAMYDCFDQFGAGTLELFETRRGSTDNYCVVCSKLTFTEKGKEIKGLAEYLTTVTVPGQKYTYFEFLKGSGASEEEVKTLEKIAPFDITYTSKPYAVMFAYGKTTGWWDKLSAGSIAGTAGIVVGGAVAGFFTGGIGWVVAAAAVAGGSSLGVAVVKAPYLESDWQAGVMVMPYDETIKESLKKAGTDCSELPVK